MSPLQASQPMMQPFENLVLSAQGELESAVSKTSGTTHQKQAWASELEGWPSFPGVTQRWWSFTSRSPLGGLQDTGEGGSG